jgi:hypothetical protein
MYFKKRDAAAENNQRGACVRYPPTVIEAPDGLIQVRPDMDPVEFCGEFKVLPSGILSNKPRLVQ